MPDMAGRFKAPGHVHLFCARAFATDTALKPELASASSVLTAPQAEPPCSIRCSSTMSRYIPLPAMSSPWLPAWAIAPSSRTRIRSAWRIVLRRWAITNDVRPRRSWPRLCWIKQLALAVEIAGRFIEDEDLGVGEDSPCNRQPLTLAAAQSHAALADQGIVAVGEPVDKFGGIRHASGLLDSGPVAQRSP